MFDLAIKLVSSTGFCGRKDWRATIRDTRGPCSNDRLPDYHATRGQTVRITAQKESPPVHIPTADVYLSHTSESLAPEVASSRCGFRCESKQPITSAQGLSQLPNRESLRSSSQASALTRPTSQSSTLPNLRPPCPCQTRPCRRCVNQCDVMDKEKSGDLTRETPRSYKKSAKRRPSPNNNSSLSNNKKPPGRERGVCCNSLPPKSRRCLQRQRCMRVSARCKLHVSIFAPRDCGGGSGMR